MTVLFIGQEKQHPEPPFLYLFKNQAFLLSNDRVHPWDGHVGRCNTWASSSDRT
jgi:hypothetical protein